MSVLASPGQKTCACAMGHLFRFAEPVLLYLLKKKGQSYGYELAGQLPEYALTTTDVETGTLYRTLRQMEKNGCVRSEWDMNHPGPARRLYSLTPYGEEHLTHWLVVLHRMEHSMHALVDAARQEGFIDDADLAGWGIPEPAGAVVGD